ncbi:MAG: NUDIX hydrolase [Actinomycetales bacterium]|nr:NUDIX hydrolase [Actinomycetales bacterium]
MSSQPALAVSTVIFALRSDATGNLRLALPLVRRIRSPFEGRWALPGGPLAENESISDSAARTLAATTGLTPSYLEQLYAFGGLDRSPALSPDDPTPERVVSIVYWALVGSAEAEQTLASENVQWFFADELPELAFDHNLIVEYALWRLRNKVGYSRVAHGFLSERFTLAELREVYEAILGKQLDPGNFRRAVEASGAVVPTGERLGGTKHRPPMLYRYNSDFDLTDQGPLNPNRKTTGASA